MTNYPGHLGQITSLSLRPINRLSEEEESPTLNRSAARFSPRVQRKSKSRSQSPTKNADPKSTRTTQGKEAANAAESSLSSQNLKIKQEKLDQSAPKKTEGGEPKPELNSKERDVEAVGNDNGGATTSGETNDVLDIEAELAASLGVVPDEESGDGNIKKEPTSDKSESGKSLAPPATASRRPSSSGISGKGSKGEDSDDDDNDSLFGGGDDEEPDAEGEEDVDAEGDDDDVPLSQLKQESKGDGLALPGISASQPEANGKSSNESQTNGKQKPNSKSVLSSKPLPGSSFDSDLSTFSNDVLLTSTLAGQVLLWDRRVRPSLTGSGSGSSNSSNPAQAKGVRSLPLPSKTPPWCQSASWSPKGDKIYVGRRNESVDEWDVRMLPDNTGASNQDGGKEPKLLRSLKLPNGSGPVSSVATMPNGRHVLW